MRSNLFLSVFFVAFTLVPGCNKQQAHSSPLTGFEVAQAMKMFYGNYDPVKQSSTVTFTKTERVRTSEEPMTVRPLFHTLSGDAAAPNFVLLTYAVPTSDEKYYCHACAPTIGMAVFSEKATGWTVTSSNRAVTDAGEFGKPPTDIGLVQIGTNHQAVEIIDVGGGNGETTAVLLILIPWNGTVSVGLERLSADDDAGMCDSDVSSLPCYSNHRSVAFLPDGKKEYFDLQLKLSGTDLPLSEGKHSNRARVVLGEENLRFENGKYVQMSRQGDLTYVDRIVAEREGLK
jgi:hypothetical protein